MPKHGGARLPVGAHPGNTGGKAGRSGRKPDEFKALCAELVSNTQTIRAAGEILADRGHPAWASVFRAIAPYGYGAPPQTLEVTGGTANELVIRVRHEAPSQPVRDAIGSASWADVVQR